MKNFDQLLSFGCALDWLTPAWAYLNDFLQGSASYFGIPAFSGWGRRELGRLLRDNGVEYWGLMYNFHGDVLLFTVRADQAALAYDVLRYYGVPLLYVPELKYEPDYAEPILENEFNFQP